MTARGEQWIVAGLALATLVAALAISTRVAGAAPAAVLEQLFASTHAAHRPVARPIKRKVRRHSGRQGKPRSRPARAAVRSSPSQAARAVSLTEDQLRTVFGPPIDFDAAFGAFASATIASPPIVPRAIPTVSLPPAEIIRRVHVPPVTERDRVSALPATVGAAVTGSAAAPTEKFSAAWFACVLLWCALAAGLLVRVLRRVPNNRHAIRRRAQSATDRQKWRASHVF